MYAKAHENRVLCVELNRGRIADPFVPFGVSPIGAAQVAQLAAPIGKVLSAALAQRS